MPLHTGELLELNVEKPVAGGRMLARHENRVVLVQGCIPGERVMVCIDRVERQLAFASTVDLLEASPDRRPPFVDPSCGGCLYAHIAYERQLQLKREIVQDAFARLGRLPVERPPIIASPPEGYRMRARLHVRDGQCGFYREGTHELCDAGATRQLTGEAVAAATHVAGSLRARGAVVSAIELAENMTADQRVVHVTLAPGSPMSQEWLEPVCATGALHGCSADVDGALVLAGVPFVGDSLADLTRGRAADGTLERHGQSFFQANRFLLPDLVGAVLDSVSPAGPVLELYAGVGLFSVALAACGHEDLTAVEGDRRSGTDLTRNAAAYSGTLRPIVGSVEDYLRRPSARPQAIIVDPPRTGISRPAMEALVRAGAGRVIYVSCDPATMARDARRLVDGGYRLASLQTFDLFPNTPHVESLALFDRTGAAAG